MKVKLMLKLLEEYEIKELVRTGVCALERGANDITDYCEIFNQLGGSKWQVASGKWQVVSGKWQVEEETPWGVSEKYIY